MHKLKSNFFMNPNVRLLAGHSVIIKAGKIHFKTIPIETFICWKCDLPMTRSVRVGRSLGRPVVPPVIVS